MKTTTPRPSAAIRSDIESHPVEARLAFLRHQAIEFRISFLTEVLEAQLTDFKSGEDLINPRNHGGICTLLANCDQGQELAGLLALKTVLEGSEHFKAAAPLKALDIELAAAIEAETEKERQRHHFAQELAEVEAETLRKLEAKVADDPAVIEARKKLDAVA